MYFLFDIGGTKTRLAATKNYKEFMAEPIVVETPKNFEEGIELLSSLAKEVCGGEQIKMAAGGIAGPLDTDKTKLINSPNITEWNEKPLKKELERVLGVPVFLRNDSALVGLGEAHFGAGRGVELMVYITISTGVGGVRIIKGEIAPNRYGFEPGHQIIDIDGSEWSGAKGEEILTLGDYISGAATEKRFGKKPYEIEDPKVWDQLARWLAAGLANTVIHWSPDVVVLGGSMIVKRPGIDIEKVRSYFSTILEIFSEKPELRLAELKDFGGLYGAMALLNQQKDST